MIKIIKLAFSVVIFCITVILGVIIFLFTFKWDEYTDLVEGILEAVGDYCNK